MIVPELIKAGDNRLKLGFMNPTPPRVDCRVVSEDNYQQFLKVLAMVRHHDIENYLNGEGPLFPLKLRESINDILTSHGI